MQSGLFPSLNMLLVLSTFFQSDLSPGCMAADTDNLSLISSNTCFMILAWWERILSITMISVLDNVGINIIFRYSANFS
ncbi:hypothetical protein CLONEX_03438 [[Clostridium] nexile DSM 1787]|nr:hypothetical protein CLONEX_03438 [[Clostridium] nexile DSM 1787]